MSRPPHPPSEGEATLLRDIKLLGLPEPTTQFKFAEEYGRKWRFDLCWPDRMLAVEVVGKPHTIKERFAADCERELAAHALGWIVIRFSPKQIREGFATCYLEAFFLGRELTPVLARLGILTPPGEGRILSAGWNKSQRKRR